MTYRLLEVSEWTQIEHEFTTRNCSLPDPNLAVICGAFGEDGLLKGFLVCQLQLHFEPLVVAEPFAVRGLIRKMEEELQKTGNRSYYAFAPNENIAGICEAMGLVDTGYKTYHKAL